MNFKGRMKILAPVVAVLIILLAATVFVSLQKARYETGDADIAVAEAMEHYNKAVTALETAADEFKNVNFFLAFQADLGKAEKELADLDTANNTLSTNLRVAGDELSLYDENIEAARSYKVRDEYLTYLNERENASNQLREVIDSYNAAVPTLGNIHAWLSESVSMLRKMETVNVDLGDDLNAYNDLAHQMLNDVNAWIASSQPLLGTPGVPATVNDFNNYFLTGFNLLVEGTEAAANGNYATGMDKLSEAEQHFNDEQIIDLELVLISDLDSWWNNEYKTVSSQAESGMANAESSQKNAKKKYDDEIRDRYYWLYQ